MHLVDPHLIETPLTVYRPIDGGADILRQFTASINYRTDDGPEDIGSVHGWVGWSIADDDVHVAADAISGDAEALGAAAAEIIADHPDLFVDDVLLIDRMYLDTEWRGNRISGAIISDLMSLLRFERESSVVVLQPEPQDPSGGPMDDGPGRRAALARLQSAYRESGLEQWAESDVWWRPLP